LGLCDKELTGMNVPNDHDMIGGQYAPAGPDERSNFAAPLGATASGRLVFASGAAGVALLAKPALPDLCRVYFARHMPSIRVQDGTVTIQYRHVPLFDWLVERREPLAEIALNGSIPWELEFRGGVSRLTADLRELPLRSLDLSSASQVVVILPRPVGAAYIHIAESASNVAFHHPAGVAVRAQISGGASDLIFDAQRFGAVAGGLRWQTPDYTSLADRYEISVAGSASALTIDTL
jgi:hypothetical protein